MKFKRLLVTTVIAASQVALVIPANAAELVQNQPIAAAVSEQTTVPTSPSVSQNVNDGKNLVQPSGQTSGTSGTAVPQGTEIKPSDNQQSTNSGANTNSGTNTNPTTTDGTNTGTNSGTDTGSSTDTGNNGSAVPATQPATPSTDQSVEGSDSGQLILMMNSKKMYQNGKEYLAGYPMEVKNGVSYISIRAIVERAGFKFSYDSKTKETIIKRAADELRFKVNTNSYKVNGVTKAMKGKSYNVKGNFMVPLTAITNALSITYKVDSVGKRVIVNLSTLPVASFTISNKEIIAGETQVQYVTSSTSPIGLPIVNEEWTGRQDMFDTPGTYPVTYRVQDSSGQWSEPYTLNVTVNKPHTPPVADFKTDKDTYKMGELITYTDLSTDEVGIKDRVWENKQLAFFTPGTMTIRLNVVNVFGLSTTVEKTITITNETLYTQDEFNKIFVPAGEKYTFDGSQVPTWDKVRYSFVSEPVTLIRSNSPETVYSEGVLYRENAIGNTRFMIHHANSTGKSVKMYVIATNDNSETARLTQSSLGFGGPSTYAAAAGKASVSRYYESLQLGNKYKDMWIAPGESKIILNDLSASSMKQGDVISLLADLYSDHTLQYSVIMLGSEKDPFNSLPYLTALEPDIHNRGTYMEANRNIEFNDLIGEKPTRLLIGDNSIDPYLIGSDALKNGEYRLNAGNFGVLYRIKLYRVAPNTLITFNGRGGYYAGSIMVNGDIVQIPNSGGLNTPSENVVLFRSGDREQTVEFLFTAAPGSNLSVNLLFQQIPPKKNQ
ncbi:stalk domain-containing protein [Paenibacillus puldeungensis]|uniref:Stalk domain-containing protein n=1 Tax=Paenibacillus puldeungensis TaxID=696536 RepID=A0ABW3RVB2_9BACL